jgi:protein SCO1/2
MSDIARGGFGDRINDQQGSSREAAVSRQTMSRASIVALLALGITAACAAPPKGGGTATTLADIGPAPDVALTDQAGKAFELRSLRGKAVLVSFIYTTCGGVCPATTHTLYRVQEALKDAKLWGAKVQFVSISLDPARDTTEVLANYARAYDADASSWHFLTGPPAAVAKVVASWGMWARIGPNGTLDHPSRIFLVDPNGRQREIYSLEFLKPAVVLQDVDTVLADSVARHP